MKHLDENQIACIVDYLMGEIANIEARLLIHLIDCDDCHRSVLEVCELINEIETHFNSDHYSADKNPCPDVTIC
jgi:hypothetical protein